MPLYEYRCTQCGHRFDKIQKFNDEPESACPKCGGALKRPLTAPAFQFKGAGWYVNDYAAKPAAAGNSEKPAADSATVGADTKKSDSKPAESKPAASETKAASTSDSTPKPTSSSSAS